MPHDENAEKAVLGAILQSPKALQDSITVVKPSDFYNPKNEEIFAAIMKLFSNGQTVEPISVLDELSREGRAAKIGGATYLHSLIESVPTVTNVVFWANKVAQTAQLRRLSEMSARLHRASLASEADASALISTAYAEIDRLNGVEGNRSAAVPAQESFGSALNLLEELERNKGNHGVSTGFKDLDHILSGLRPGQVITVAARPGFGKSTLAMDFCRQASIYEGKTSLYFTLEMSHAELMLRVISAQCQVDMGHMRSGNMTDDEWKRIMARGPQIEQSKLFIDDSPGITPGEIKAKARRIKSQHGLDLIVVDYLQLLSSGMRVESRQQEVSQFSRAMKLLAMELQVPVIQVSQLNRNVDARADKRPQLSDLRESGAIEQDSDAVILIHREDQGDPDSARVNEADIIVAKQRSGPTGEVPLGFQGQYSRFVSLARDY
jgi:replicative DNA helicase